MKIEVPTGKANRLINSGNVILVTSQYKDRSSIITIAWHCPVSIKPPILGIAVGRSRFSAELIGGAGEFIVNIPDWRLFAAMLYCGTHSGRDVDKFKGAKLTPEKPVKLLKPPKIKECIGSIECALTDEKEIGDHIMFFGEVVYADAEADLFRDGVWDTEKAELIYHLGGDCFMKSCPSEKGR
jgi:flavin reductase (DIM6/NTAB) family NADH-FMN oxidoreductase RutF